MTDIVIDGPMREIDRRYLIAHTWNPYRYGGTWCAQAEELEADGLRRVWEVLGPEHPKPGATCEDYHVALKRMQ